MVEGTDVNFHCHNEDSWYINSNPIDDTSFGTNFTTSNETGREDYLTITTDSAYVEMYNDTSLIYCLRRGILGYLYAMIVITG